MKCLVVHNPASGSALGTDKLSQIFAGEGYDITKFIATGDDFEKRLASSLSSDSIVAVVGGDGTISSTVGPIIEAGATLLPLPGGTLNHFTKDLGVKQDVAAALRQAAKSETRRVDVASINDHYFINNSSLGLYPDSLKVRSRFEDKLGKWPAALIGAIRALVSWHHYDLVLDGQPITTPFVFVGNNRYNLAPLKIGSRDRIDEAVLSVAVAMAQTRWQLLKTFLRVTRNHDGDGQLKLYPTNDTITIKSRRHSIHVSTDGEIRKVKPPITYRIHPQALKIIG